MTAGHYRVCLAKQDFKFSAAHFTIFDHELAEPLHGHNYRVEIELRGDTLDDHGLLCDFEVVKKAVRARCDELDSRTLVPRNSPHVRIQATENEVAVLYADRCYRLPAQEVVVLPVRNISIEELAQLIWRLLVEDLELNARQSPRGLERLTELAVRIEETQGQSCVYSAPLRETTS